MITVLLFRRTTPLLLRVCLKLCFALLFAGVTAPTLWAQSGVTLSTSTASSRGITQDIADLDHLLAQVRPGQQILWCGDMGLKIANLQRYRQDLVDRQGGSVHTNSAFMPLFGKWPGGNVPYVFDSNVSSTNQSAFLTACNDWAQVANVNFLSTHRLRPTIFLSMPQVSTTPMSA